MGYFVKPKTDEERFWTNKLRAVIYVRVSSEGQVNQWHGLESQETICRERCQRQLWLEIEVVQVFREEGVSGKYMDRKAMNEAIKFLGKENKKYTKIHYFVVTDADRIARPDDIAEAFALEQSIEGLDVKIVTVNSKRDTETDEGKFLHTIQYAVAGLERRKILRRTMNGRLNALKRGWRPFTNPPVWYLREKSQEKWYIDVIDKVKWIIIKEGLELYAFNPLFTKSQLYHFRKEKGLQTWKSKGRLYISFIEKTFRDYRLYFYAWYIYYPEWEINDPIKWKQEALVSIEVIKKIMEKESLKTKKIKSPNFDNNLKLHPLKWIITCFGCGRKLGCYASKWNGWTYYYYNCWNMYCLERPNIRKETLEKEFEGLIEKMKLPKSVFQEYQRILLKERQESKNRKTISIPQLQWQLLSIQVKLKNIENKVLTITNERLIIKLEEERSTLESLQNDLVKKINNHKNDEDNFEMTLAQSEPMFTNPVLMRNKSSFEIRQLLTMVWFGKVLYYKKKQWLRTNKSTGLYCLFSLTSGTDYHLIRRGGINWNPLLFSKSQLKRHITYILAQSNFINAIHKVYQLHWLNMN